MSTGQHTVFSILATDDDGNFETKTDLHLTAEELQAKIKLFKEEAPFEWRPLTVSGYVDVTFDSHEKLYHFETKFAVTWVRDRWGEGAQNGVEDWELVFDFVEWKFEDEIERLAGEGFRPISVSGYAYYQDFPIPNLEDSTTAYAGIFVRDTIKGGWNIWLRRHKDELYETILTEHSAGRCPLSISSRMEADPVHWYWHSAEGKSNVKFTLITIDDRVQNGVEPDSRNDAWIFSPTVSLDDWHSKVSGLKKDGYRLVACVPYRWIPSLDDEAAYELMVPLWFFLVYRRHPQRYLRVHDALEEVQDLPDLSSLDNRVRNEMETQLVNAAALTVSRDGELIYSKGFTWAPEGFPTTLANSQFRCGSVSKSITATAVIKALQDKAILDWLLNNPVVTVEDLFFDQPEASLISPQHVKAKQASIKDLLQHRAGFSEEATKAMKRSGMLKVRAWQGGDWPITLQQIFGYWLGLPTGVTPADAGWGPGVEPAVGWHYSNLNYELLADYLENLSKDNLSYEEWVKQYILLPIGAIDTHLGRSGRFHHLPGEVVGSPTFSRYLGDKPVSEAPDEPFSTPSVLGDNADVPLYVTGPYAREFQLGELVRASGGWVSTSPDLVRFLDSLRDRDHEFGMVDQEGALILTRDSVNVMWPEAVVSGAEEPPGSGAPSDTPYPSLVYALGWYTQGGMLVPVPAKERAYFHGGNIDGAYAMIRQAPAQAGADPFPAISWAFMMSRNRGSMERLRAIGGDITEALGP